MAQTGQGADVELDLACETGRVELVEPARRPESGAVDHQVDRTLAVGDPFGDSQLTVVRREIGDEHVEAVMPFGQLFQPIAAAGHQDGRDTGPPELLGDLRTDPTRRPVTNADPNGTFFILGQDTVMPAALRRALARRNAANPASTLASSS